MEIKIELLFYSTVTMIVGRRAAVRFGLPSKPKGASFDELSIRVQRLGGSDDLVSCALMMELIRLLAHKPDTLKHDVIFLFNGAEESSLQVDLFVVTIFISLLEDGNYRC